MKKQHDIGVIGLGVMGAALAKNMINHGYDTALYSVSEKERTVFAADKGEFKIYSSISDFIESLKAPRRIFLMITAGKPVDMVLEQLFPLLDGGDVIMDGGNSYYKDTERRDKKCRDRGLCFLGVGVSGGESGALNGPSMMAGGSREGWQQAKDILQEIAAQHEGKPCCEYIAPGGAGHFVKMVHNGIEYAILELLAEAYQFLRFGNRLCAGEIRDVFAGWQKGELNSYLMELSVRVLEKKDEDGLPLIDKILDVAEQKGTGKWTITEAIDRGVYIPAIYEAQAIRTFSSNKELRSVGARILPFGKAENMAAETAAEKNRTVETAVVEKALLLAIVIAYSQGFELIEKASVEEGWNIDCPALAKIWSNGCIIRSRLLGKIGAIQDLKQTVLILTEEMAGLCTFEKELRTFAADTVLYGMACPAFLACLSYYDSYRTDNMQVNFIQALRDCFGAHTYMREDKKGYFHSEW